MGDNDNFLFPKSSKVAMMILLIMGMILLIHFSFALPEREKAVELNCIEVCKEAGYNNSGSSILSNNCWCCNFEEIVVNNKTYRNEEIKDCKIFTKVKDEK